MDPWRGGELFRVLARDSCDQQLDCRQGTPGQSPDVLHERQKGEHHLKMDDKVFSKWRIH